MDLTKPEDTKKLFDQILKANKPLSLDSPEVRALDGKEENIETTQKPVTETQTIQSGQPLVKQMFERAAQGDVDFDKPTKEQRKAYAEAYFKSQEPEPQPFDPDIINKKFERAKKGDF